MAGLPRLAALVTALVFGGSLPFCAQPPAKQLTAVDSLGDPLPSGARLRLGTSRFRPPSSVAELALSPDEKTVVTVGGELIVWEAATGKELWRAGPRDLGVGIRNSSYGVRAVVFAPDGSRFYTAGKPDELLVWQTLGGTHEVLTIKASRRNSSPIYRGARSVDVAPDGQKLALGSASGLVVCDLSGNVRYDIANAPEGPGDLDRNDRLSFAGHYSLGRFSPDGKLLAVVTSDHPDIVQLCDAGTGRLLRKLALASRLVRFAFSPDSSTLAATERDNAVRLYDTATGARRWSHVVKLTNKFENYTSALAYSPDGKILAVCATDNRIHFINAATGGETAALEGHHWYPWALAFTKDGKMLYSSGFDGFIRRWNVPERKQLALSSGVRATGVIALAPDGRTLAYEIDSGAIRIVLADSGKEGRLLALENTRYSQLTFSPDGRKLAGGGTCGNQVHVALWDVGSGKLSHRWDWPTGPDPHSEVESLCFAPDGSRLAAAVFRQFSAYIWDLETGKQTSKIGHTQIYGVSFSSDARTLVTVGWDSVIRFWEADTGEPAGEIKVGDLDPNGDLRMYAVCWEPGGSTIATAHLDGMVRIWDARTHKLRTRFQVRGRFIHGALAFSPDGLWLATGGMDGSVCVWDPVSGQIVRDVGRHQSYVYTLGFGRGIRSLASGGSDGLCYLWDLRPLGARADRDVSRLWRDLTGEDGPTAYEAVFALADIPDRAVAMLAENLRRVQTVVDLDRIADGSADEEAQRRRRLTKLLVERDPKVKLAIGVRRAVSLLEQIGTPAATALLKELAAQGATKDIGRLAAARWNDQTPGEDRQAGTASMIDRSSAHARTSNSTGHLHETKVPWHWHVLYSSQCSVGLSVVMSEPRQDVRRGTMANRKAQPSPSLGARAVTFDTVREIAHGLPGAVEGTSYGTPAFRVGKSLFVRKHQDDDSLVVKIDHDERAMRMKADPDTFYITDHYRNYPWILVRLATVEVGDLRDLLEDAWRLSATERAVARYDRDRKEAADARPRRPGNK